MIQKKNKGVTLVEVLIALAVFLILMTPLIASLITSVKTTDSGKEYQSRNDYAEVLIEKVKTAPIEDLKDNSKVAKYFEGSKNVTVVTSKSAKYPDSDDFTITGTTYLGTKAKKYTYKIEGIYDRKTDSYGIMEDLDPYKSAFVPVTFSNYDDVASEAIVTQKLDAKTNAAGSTIFSKKDDVSSMRGKNARRDVNITMTGNKTSGFEVKCEIKYTESGKSITYKPYTQKFKNIPNIYLMYNVGVYNDSNTKDYINYDVTGVNFGEFEKKERINAFIIGTSNDYSAILDNFKNADNTYDESRLSELTNLLSTKLKGDITNNKNQLVSGTGTTSLYRKTSAGNRNYDVTVNGGVSSISKERFKVYHNLYYSDGAGDHPFVTVGNNISDNLDIVKDAHEEVWSIYNVKVWIQEGDSVNSDDNMVTLQGTRGGGEIE